MKKIIITLAIVFVMTTVAFAGTKDNCGCGLGSIAFEGQDGLVSQLAAATTNNVFFGNQTFGITSGTLGCDKPADYTKNEKLDEFVAGNMDNLATDIASGQGESLDTLAELAEISAEHRAAFFAALQDNFSEIYPSPEVTHTDVVRKIITLVEQI